MSLVPFKTARLFLEDSSKNCDWARGLSGDLLGAATAVVNLAQNRRGGLSSGKGTASGPQWFWFLLGS